MNSHSTQNLRQLPHWQSAPRLTSDSSEVYRQRAGYDYSPHSIAYPKAYEQPPVVTNMTASSVDTVVLHREIPLEIVLDVKPHKLILRIIQDTSEEETDPNVNSSRCGGHQNPARPEIYRNDEPTDPNSPGGISEEHPRIHHELLVDVKAFIEANDSSMELAVAIQSGLEALEKDVRRHRPVFFGSFNGFKGKISNYRQHVSEQATIIAEIAEKVRAIEDFVSRREGMVNLWDQSLLKMRQQMWGTSTTEGMKKTQDYINEMMGNPMRNIAVKPEADRLQPGPKRPQNLVSTRPTNSVSSTPQSVIPLGPQNSSAIKAGSSIQAGGGGIKVSEIVAATVKSAIAAIDDGTYNTEHIIHKLWPRNNDNKQNHKNNDDDWVQERARLKAELALTAEPIQKSWEEAQRRRKDQQKEQEWDTGMLAKSSDSTIAEKELEEQGTREGMGKSHLKGILPYVEIPPWPINATDRDSALKHLYRIDEESAEEMESEANSDDEKTQERAGDEGTDQRGEKAQNLVVGPAVCFGFTDEEARKLAKKQSTAPAGSVEDDDGAGWVWYSPPAMRITVGRR